MTWIVRLNDHMRDRETDATQQMAQHKWRVRMLFLHGAMLMAPVALLSLSRFHINIPGSCLYKRLLGIDCPACGITHSVVALMDGRIGEAFHLHPAGPFIAGIIGVMVSYVTIVLLTGWSGYAWRIEVKVYSLLDRLAVILLVLGWVGKQVVN